MNIIAKSMMLLAIALALLSFLLNTVALFDAALKGPAQASIFVAALLFALAMLLLKAKEAPQSARKLREHPRL